MQSSQRLAYIPALDGLRAAAVIAVLLFHETSIGPARLGSIGVYVFFVLSGFLITSLLINEWEQTGNLNMPRFLRHRFFRLMPALGVMLLVLAAARWLPYPPGLDVGHMLPRPAALIAAMTYTTNILMAYGVLVPEGPLSHTWTLAIEAQFYILWPFVLRAALPLPERRRGLLFLLALCIVGLGLGRPLASIAGASPIYLFLSTEANIDGLMIGCLIAMLLWDESKWQHFDRHWSYRWLVAITIIAFVVACGIFLASGSAVYQRQAWPWPTILLSVISSSTSLITATIIISLIRSPYSPLSSILSLPLTRYIGKISYSLYLWHLPIIAVCTFALSENRMLNAATAIITSFFVAILSFHFIESPARKLGRQITHRQSVYHASN